MGLIDLAPLRSAVLDTSACVYYVEYPEDDPRRRVVAPLIDAAVDGDLSIVIPTIAGLELLTGPMRDESVDVETLAYILLTQTPGVHTVPLTLEIAYRAARLRARYRLRTPDAAILATGIALGANAVVGNDARWKVVAEVRYIHIDDVVRA